MSNKNHSTDVWIQTDNSGTLIGMGNAHLFFDSPRSAAMVIGELLRKIHLSIPPEKTLPGAEQATVAREMIEYLEERYGPYFQGKETFIRMELKNNTEEGMRYEECFPINDTTHTKTNNPTVLNIANSHFPGEPPLYIKVGMTESLPTCNDDA